MHMDKILANYNYYCLSLVACCFATLNRRIVKSLNRIINAVPELVEGPEPLSLPFGS